MVDFKIKVLVLDDKAFMLEEIYDYISSNNVKSIYGINYDFDIYTSASPYQALDLFINIMPDIVVVDFKLEDEKYDGIKYIEEILKIKKNVKIIGIASQADENVEIFKGSNLDAFIEKPFQDTYINSRIDFFVKEIIISDNCNYISDSQKALIIEKSKEVKPKEKIKITNKFKNMRKNKSIEKIEKKLREDESSLVSDFGFKGDVKEEVKSDIELSFENIEYKNINPLDDCKNVDTTILGEDIGNYSLLDKLGMSSNKKNKKNNEILFTYDDEDTYNELTDEYKTSKNIDDDFCDTKKIASKASEVTFDICNKFNKDYNGVTKDSKNLLDTSLKYQKENKKDEYQSDKAHTNEHIDFYDLDLEDLPDRSKLLKELYADDDIQGNNKGVNKNNSSPIIGRILKRRV